MKRHDEINKLFKSYTAAFDVFDPEAISAHYTLPCATSDADGVKVFNKRKSLINKFNQNCKSMKAMRYTHSQYKIISTLDMDENQKSVVLSWRIFLNTETIEFRCMYVCHKVDNKLLIFNANVFQGRFDLES